MDRFIVRHKRPRLDNENGHVKEEVEDVTDVQPQQSQQEEEEKRREEEKCELTEQPAMLARKTRDSRSSTVAERSTRATFSISWRLARDSREFTDAELVKECFLVSAGIMLQDLQDKESIIEQINGLQFSPSTITRHVEDIGEDICKQLTADVAAAPCFSIALDEYDVCYATQLCVWVRFPQQGTSSFREELLCLLPLRGPTRGDDVLKALGDFFAENGIDWSTLASVCTGGSPSLRGEEDGLIGLMRRREDIPHFVAFHCVIRQEVLVAQLGDGELRDVMQKVVEVVDFIVECGLHHWQFRELLEAHQTEHGDLTLHDEVLWLSRGRVLERFLRLLPRIREVVASNGRDEPDLHDPRWILKLALLADITSHLNSVGLQLQGKGEAPSNVPRVITAFQNKIATLLIPDRQFVHFPNLREVTTAQPDMLEHYSYDAHVRVLERLKQEIGARFKDIMEYKDLYNFMENPFRVSVSSLTPAIAALCADRAGIESEIVELQANETLQGELRSGVAHFWDLVPDADYPLLKRCVQKVASFFVGTQSCEATLSTVNVVKQNLWRNRLTIAHLDCLTRIATTGYTFRMP